jgi:tetratricopeptide (TPR) repeat protein
MSETQAWIAAVGEGRVREVLAALPRWPTVDSRPVLAELARLGEAPRIDLVVHGLSASEPAAFAAAIAELCALGAPKTAACYVERRPDEPSRAAGKAALDAPRMPPLRDLHRSSEAELRARLEGTRSAVERIAIRRLFAARAVARHEFAAAAEHLLRPDVAESGADLAGRARIEGALATWAAGDRARARELFAALHDVLGAEDVHLLEAKLGGTTSGAWTWATGLAKGAHDDGRGVVVALGHPVPSHAVPELAELDVALRKLGLVTLRIELDPTRAERALAAGATVVLEEERSMRTGIRLLLGVAAADDLYLVRDPDREEAVIVPAHWQRARSWLFASSALVVCGAGEEGATRKAKLIAAGLVPSARLEAMDRTSLDEDGERRTAEARIARLRALVKADDALPIAHARLGDALLDAVRRDQIKKEELTAWYAEVRERFPAMEMPSQTYAAYLEQFGSSPEAGIAWASAFHRDRFDARNAIGWGRALKRMDKIEDAFARFRDASRLDPDDAMVYGWFSTCHYARAEWSLAELTARISAELMPTYRSARTLLADALEAQHDVAAAEPVLAEAWELAHLPEDGVRLVRARYRRGDLAGAKTLATEIAGRAGGESIGDAVVVHVADGDDAGAAELARGLLRGQPVAGWTLWFVDGATTLASDEATAHARIAEATEAFGRDVVALCDLALELAPRGLWNLAVPVLDRLRTNAPDNPNTPWTWVRAVLRSGRLDAERDAVREACGRLTSELAPGFVPVRAVAAAVELPVDPKRALELCSHASFTDDPKSWLVAALALRAMGEEARATQLFDRLAGLAPATLALVSDFYRFYELWDLCRETLRCAKSAWNDDKYLSLEHVAVAIHDRASDCVERTRVARERWEWVPVSWTCAAAVRSADRDALVAAAAAGEKVVTSSSATAGDPWVYRAFAAAAAGDEARAALLEKLPRHPWVRAALVHGGAALGRATVDADRLALVANCPISSSAVLRRWEGP